MAAARLRPAESCSDIANAGTSPTTPSAPNEAVIRPVAVLLWSSAVNPAPAPNAAKRLRSAFERRRTQIGTERSNGPALDHVQAPKAARQCPPIKSRRTSVPIGAWPRQPAAWTSFGATGIRTRALAPAVSVSGKRDFAFNTTGHQGICRTLARHSQAVRFV